MCYCTEFVGGRMPGFDGTGPRGLGAMTGGRRGFCTGYFPTSYPYRMYPWGRVFQTVLPRIVPPTTTPTVSPYVQTPFGTPFVPSYSKEQEKQMLEQQIRMLEGQLEAIRKRLGELGK